MMEKKYILYFLFLLPFFMILVIAETEEENPDDLIQLTVTRNKIMTAQYECYQKIMQDPIQQTEGITATEPGTDGYAGMMLLQEQNQCSIALITFRTLILQKKLRKSVTKMETGLDIQKATEHGQIIPSVILTHMRKYRLH